ncbi:hypothetical protein TcWFU_004134 [Taenia crassiceps]|uniref:Uncharacterized protein n=1 Tax=Taenia crassiceps TaxID=6207 RepID=A0ABR4QGA3_9CEST
MSSEFRDDYGNFVVSNYSRNRDLATGAAAAQNAQPYTPPPKQWSAAAHTRRPLYKERMIFMPVPEPQNQNRMQYCTGMPQWSQRWPSLKPEPEYLSLDSDSDSSSCSDSSTCYCSSCGGNMNRSSSTSSSGCYSCSCDYVESRQRSPKRSQEKGKEKSSSRGRRDKCDCDSSIFSSSSFSSSTCSLEQDRNRKCVSPEKKDERSSKRKSKERCNVCHKPVANVREKTIFAAESPSRYHRCQTPRAQMPSQSRGPNCPFGNGHYRGVNTELRPGPSGNGIFTEDDVIRKYNLVCSRDTVYPKPDYVLYPKS